MTRKSCKPRARDSRGRFVCSRKTRMNRTAKRAAKRILPFAIAAVSPALAIIPFVLASMVMP